MTDAGLNSVTAFVRSARLSLGNLISVPMMPLMRRVRAVDLAFTSLAAVASISG